MWGSQLRAGKGDKILWAAKEAPGDLHISTRPYGQSSPVVAVQGQITNVDQMPSTVSVPTPGCWSFTVSWGLWGQVPRMSTINLQVLPEGRR